MELDDLFHIISRLILIFPIGLIIIALIIKFNQSSVNNFQNLPVTLTLTLTPTSILISSPSAQLDLTGPLICDFSFPTSTISAYIKDKKIFAVIKEKNEIKNLLFRDDCLYIWKKNDYLGRKKCGLSPYIKMIDKISLKDIKDIKYFYQAFGFSLPIDFNDEKNLIDSCREKEINNEEVFRIPREIVFE